MSYTYKNRPDKMTMLIRGYGFNGATLGKAISVSHDTARRRMAFPEDLTLGELRKLKKYIPEDEIRAAI